MLRWSVVLCIVTVGLTLAQATWSDTWRRPRPRLFVSEDRQFGMKVLPAKGIGLGDKQKANGILFRLEETGRETVLWKGKLVNLPVDVFVDDAGVDEDRPAAVATVDTYGFAGYEHALVLYDGRGKVVRDFRLEDLLTHEEIEAHTSKSVSSRRWASRAELGFYSGYFWIRFKWGKTLKLSAATGAIIKE
jgi:hypothetical protein